MDHVFSIDDELVCGRPGPNLVPWDPGVLWDGGIRAVLSVNDGELVHQDDLIAAGLDYQCTPLAENAPPRHGDLELCLARLPTAFEFVSSHVDAGRKTLIHCRQGRDRTGLFLAYYISKRFNVGPEEALSRVKSARPDALAAVGWEAFALRVLGAPPS